MGRPVLPNLRMLTPTPQPSSHQPRSQPCGKHSQAIFPQASRISQASRPPSRAALCRRSTPCRQAAFAQHTLDSSRHTLIHPFPVLKCSNTSFCICCRCPCVWNHSCVCGPQPPFLPPTDLCHALPRVGYSPSPPPLFAAPITALQRCTNSAPPACTFPPLPCAAPRCDECLFRNWLAPGSHPLNHHPPQTAKYLLISLPCLVAPASGPASPQRDSLSSSAVPATSSACCKCT